MDKYELKRRLNTIEQNINTIETNLSLLEKDGKFNEKDILTIKAFKNIINSPKELLKSLEDTVNNLE